MSQSMASRMFQLLGIALLLVTLFSGPAATQEIDSEGSEAAITRLENTLASATERADRENITDQSIRFIRRQADYLITTATVFRAAAEERSARYGTLLSALGPPPAEGGPPESPAIQDRRNAFGSQIAAADSQAKRAGLVITSAELLLRELTDTSQRLFFDRLVTYRASVLDLTVWDAGLREIATTVHIGFVDAPIAWANAQAKAQDFRSFLTRIVILTLALSLIAIPARRWLIRRYGRTPEIEAPTYRRRALAGFAEGVAHGLFPMVFIALAMAAIQGSLELDPTFETVFQGVAENLLIFFFVWGLINGVLPRNGGNWHVTNLSEKSTRRLAWRLKVVMLVFVFFRGLIEALAWQPGSDEAAAVFMFVYAIMLYPALAALSMRGLWQTVTERASDDSMGDVDHSLSVEVTKSEPVLSAGLRRSLALALTAIPISAVAGYANLAYFLAEGAVLTGILAGAALLLRWLKNEFVATMFDPQTAATSPARRLLGLSDRDISRSVFIGNLLLDILIIGAVLILLFPAWGFSSETAFAQLVKLFRGIQIGSFTLSLADILIAVSLFVITLTVTRLLQRNLDKHFLPKITRDVGIRNAFKTGIGYTGFVIAALIGIAAVGIDLSNLAIVVGALSVGIGFGLQNVVNNFVSGLILLIERPIKEGDWVVIGGNEGMVKSVNVRSTEIETFQRASVIIPNADLIASPVTNWTHKNVQGRVEIAIGVAYGSDTAMVKELLLQIGRAHPKVMKSPEPHVIFKDFGASSLDFELRCFLDDVMWVVWAASDIRFEIDKAFREHGIEIPFPQRVVHMAADGTTGSDAETP